MNYLLIGPYVGDWEQEIVNFRPYVRWLCDSLEYDEVFVSSHYNRLFLYDFIPESNKIPIYKHLSVYEYDQVGYYNKRINQKSFRNIVKYAKQIILNDKKCVKRDITNYQLNYVKNVKHVPIYNKIFEKIKVSHSCPLTNMDKIVFIPDIKSDERLLNKIHYHVLNNYDSIIIGDMKTEYPEDNIITPMINYFDFGFQYIIDHINTSRMVICPTGVWTFISNLQGKPVFSWGENVSSFKDNGVYNFDNKKSFILPTNNETNSDLVIRSLDKFIKDLKIV